MAQILHHIDADTPIRMLVAECEQPTTVLAALYFAKLFGIEDKVDVSPLFETETALEHGGRFSTRCWPNRPIAPMPACAAAGDPDRLFRRGPLRGPDPRRAGHRAPAGPPCRR
jgi:hypothetical protein